MESLPQSAGIYVITCTVNGKIYVGSSNNLRQRQNEHLSYLRRGIHANAHLQNAWNKYGDGSFAFGVLELVMPWFTLQREQYWLDKLKPYGKRGYNIANHAEAPNTGMHPTAETRQKISNANKGHPAWNKGLPAWNRGKPSPNKGKPLSDDTRQKISASKTGKPGWGKGEPKSDTQRAKISAANKGKPKAIEHRTKLAKANAFEWIVTDPDGQEQRIINLRQFCRDHELNQGTMGQVAKGVYTHHKGWKCRRA